MQERAHDVVIFGATGFTGGLVADYLARNAPESLRWALAGRNHDKLFSTRARVSRLDPAAERLPLVVADSEDPDSLRRLAESTRVVISTVGPFARVGEPLFAACARAGTDYVDSTGEPMFVRTMTERYDAAARQSGAIMVSCCGVDSIPTDLGVFFTMRELAPTGPVEVEGHFSFRARPSGGTWQSVLEAMQDVRATMRGKPTERTVDGRRVRPLPQSLRRDPDGGYLVPFPTIDPEIALTSASHLPMYGPDFAYAHYMCVPSLSKLALLGTGTLAVLGLSQLSLTRAWLSSMLVSGEGPSEEERDKSWFRVRFVARHAGDELVTEVSGGDPGYDETAKMLAESALSLSLDRARLPAKAGVLTPAVAMGEVLLARLIRAGLGFRVVER
jgi:saccharopine dehydrogenase (NAD+, L-glutamate forming)